jgi:hypothetical protein
MPINKNILVHVIKRYEDGSVIRAKGPDGEFYPCARTDEKKSHTYASILPGRVVFSMPLHDLLAEYKGAWVDGEFVSGLKEWMARGKNKSYDSYLDLV